MKIRFATAVGALTCLLIVGCATKPTLYYTLANGSAQTTVPAGAPGNAQLYFELAAITLPERLARPQMVVRHADDANAQVYVLEQHRWASSFENELRDALASGLATQLGAIDITKGGRQASAPVYRIAVQVRQFDAIEGSRIDGSFSWTIRRTDESRTTACQMRTSQPVGSGMDALALGARQLTNGLATAIARSLTSPAATPANGCSV